MQRESLQTIQSHIQSHRQARQHTHTHRVPMHVPSRCVGASGLTLNVIQVISRTRLHSQCVDPGPDTQHASVTRLNRLSGGSLQTGWPPRTPGARREVVAGCRCSLTAVSADSTVDPAVTTCHLSQSLRKVVI